ncbi:MAG: heavy metal translocating P-type ATPase [Pseudomonas sp.]|uniref:heavy metal translocating P-type ATPase n=1 Tax=Pseudomonas sp. TaxID=306 RepID=UPI0033951F4E
MEASPADDSLSTRVRIEQMDCPTEQGLIQDQLAKLPGVLTLDFNLIQRVLTIGHQTDALAGALDAIRRLGFTPVPEQPFTSGQAAEATPTPAPAKSRWPLALAGIAALAAEGLHFAQLAPEWLIAGLALAAILGSGLGTYKKGWIALRHRNLNINALMSIAVTGALLIGQWPEAAMVMVLFALAELIEAKSLERARRAIGGLLDLSPQQARVQQTDGSWQEVAVSSVALGARVRVRPGERIGLDGRVSKGFSTVDQAPITGESLPVEKAPGDALYAGTINQAGELEFQVSATAGNTTLARIVHAVEQAQNAKAPTQGFVDRFAQVYTPAVLVLALLTALLPPLVLGGQWLDWLYQALVLLVVACPCALVISTPVTLVSGLTAATRAGILIKGGLFLERGRSLDYLALDKTGTLTHGKPRQTDFLPLAANDPQAIQAYRVWAASLAGRSDHPVSQALSRAADEQGIARVAVEAFEALGGRGISGILEGQRYHLVNHRHVEDLGLCSAELEATLEPLERQGKSLVLLCSEQQVLALFAVADTLKDSSREAVRQLHALGIRTLMLTGDNPHSAVAVGKAVGIDEVRGNLLPADKLQAIQALQALGHQVGMVGDGINDAPALAQAEIGFAMGAAGSDTAIETADVALMDDDLRKVVTFVSLSRRTAAVLKQNIALALGIKALFLILVLAGHGTLWLAVFADMGVSLLVVFNGLRLVRLPAAHHKDAATASGTAS